MSNTTRFSNRMKLVSSNSKGTVLVNESPGQTDISALSPTSYQEEQDQNKAYQEGWAACEQQLQGQIAELNQALESQQAQFTDQINQLQQQLPIALGEYFQELEAQMREEVCNLSFQISETILREELEHKEVIGNIIREALAPLINLRGVVVHLSPAIVASIDQGQDYGIPTGVDIIADHSLGPGEAMLESSQGFIDATIEGRLATLKENLEKALNAKRGEHV